MTAATDILFVHTNFPAQFKLLSGYLARQPEFRIFAIGSSTARADKGTRLVKYSFSAAELDATHPFARQFEVECRRAEQVIYAGNALRVAGAKPRIIFAHPGWGEALPLRQMFPDAKIVTYCEFYYRTSGADVGFDPEFATHGVDGLTRIEMKNAATLLALTGADAGVAPTEWQRSTYPDELRSKIHVIHDGIDEGILTLGEPTFTHPKIGRPLTAGDEVLTFVARNLEPYRGFHVFMRTLPEILRARPRARVCIVGGDQISYGSRPTGHANWRQALLAEVGSQIDRERVHFLGPLPYRDYLSLLRISRAHIYLTYPFVLSWSLIEALAMGCAVIASDTAPLREVITHGENGLLVPFFDTDALARQVSEVLAQPARYAPLRAHAGELALSRYSFQRVTLPAYLALIERLLGHGAIHRDPVDRGAPLPTETIRITRTSRR